MVRVGVCCSCNSTLIGERGKLRASTEPVTDCYFRLRPPEGSRLVLTFTKFLVQSTVTQNVCLNYVEICSQSGVSIPTLATGVRVARNYMIFLVVLRPGDVKKNSLRDGHGVVEARNSLTVMSVLGAYAFDVVFVL